MRRCGWGISRGIDRLRFAPATVRTIALQTADNGDADPARRGLDPLHYQLSAADKAALGSL